MPRSTINKTSIIFISKLWPIILTILFFAFIATIISIYFLIPIGNKFVAKRFVNGVVFSPEQIEKNMCLKWPKLPNMENPSDGYYTYSHLLICSALFPKNQFFENGGYKIQNFNEISAVVTYPPFYQNPSLNLNQTIEIIETKCPNCIFIKRNFKGEAEKEIRTGKEISDNKDTTRINGLFLYFSPFMNNKNFYISRRLYKISQGKLSDIDEDLNYTFYDSSAFIAFPNSIHNEFGSLDDFIRKKIEGTTGEKIEAFFLVNKKYGASYVQFLAGKESRKIYSITCFYLMDNGNSESVNYNLSKVSDEFTKFCSSFSSATNQPNTSFKDPISKKPIFFLKEVNNVN